MNLEQKIGNPERHIEAQDRLSLPEVDLNLMRSQMSPEIAPLSQPETERKEQQADGGAVVADVKTLVGPIPSASVNAKDQPGVQGSLPFATPPEAKDLDKIEQEWVDITKQIIATTADNPHLREEQIKDLQADYLFKRYGRQAGDANNQSTVGL